MEISSVWERVYKRGFFVPLCIVSWGCYFFVLPYVWGLHLGLGILFLIFPGIYVSNLLIYFQHECWHRYFDTKYNRALFIILCTILFVQPHLYDIGHRSHHSRVNTYGDLELYPIGEIKNRLLRSLCNCLAIVFGSLFLVMLGGRQEAGISKAQSAIRFLATYTGSFLLWGAVAYGSMIFFSAPLTNVVISYACSIWAVSVFHHHHELIEHGNLIVEGDIKYRASKTRNFSAENIAHRMFLFMAHQDSREHTLHHTKPKFFSRPFVGKYEMPEDAVYINFKEYAAILGAMAIGRVTVIRQNDEVSSHQNKQGRNKYA